MTSIVIPFGYCYTTENQNNILEDSGELRYCLRSIEKHLSSVGTVYIIGNHLPTWLHGVEHIRCGDKPGKENHEWNIYNKVKVASVLHGITQPFLFLNDDHYLLQDFNADNFPYFYDKTINDYVNGRVSAYQNTNWNTRQEIGNDAHFFDVHAPILYDAELFGKLAAFNWSKPYGYLIKSMYCNLNRIEGIASEDLKIPSVVSVDWLEKMLPGKQFFSTADNCFGVSVKALMEHLYPNPSKYERTTD